MKRAVCIGIMALLLAVSAFPAGAEAEAESVYVSVWNLGESVLVEDTPPQIKVAIALPTNQTGHRTVLITRGKDREGEVRLYRGSHNPLNQFRPIFVDPLYEGAGYYIRVYVDNRLYQVYTLDFDELSYELYWDRSDMPEFEISPD